MATRPQNRTNRRVDITMLQYLEDVEGDEKEN